MVNLDMIRSFPEAENRQVLRALEFAQEQGQEMGVIDYANGTFAITSANVPPGLLEGIAGVPAGGGEVRPFEEGEYEQVLATLRESVGQDAEQPVNEQPVNEPVAERVAQRVADPEPPAWQPYGPPAVARNPVAEALAHTAEALRIMAERV